MLDKKEVAKLLVKAECLALSPQRPFTYASGLKGPIYCDNRRVLSYPKERTLIAESFANALQNSGWSFDSLAGLATAGIPHAAIVADKLELPMIYVRSSAKKHGKQNQIEGTYQAGDKVVLVEDLVNQGSSLEEALLAIEESGLIAVGCICIVDYQMQAAKARLEKFKLPLISLTDFGSIVEMALKQGMINQEQNDLLRNWQQDPKLWSVQFSG